MGNPVRLADVNKLLPTIPVFYWSNFTTTVIQKFSAQPIANDGSLDWCHAYILQLASIYAVPLDMVVHLNSLMGVTHLSTSFMLQMQLLREGDKLDPTVYQQKQEDINRSIEKGLEHLIVAARDYALVLISRQIPMTKVAEIIMGLACIYFGHPKTGAPVGDSTPNTWIQLMAKHFSEQICLKVPIAVPIDIAAPEPELSSGLTEEHRETIEPMATEVDSAQ
jgi:hypothetical protein